MSDLFEELKKQKLERDAQLMQEASISDIGRGIGSIAGKAVSGIKSAAAPVVQGFKDAMAGAPKSYDEKFKEQVSSVLKNALEKGLNELVSKKLIDSSKYNVSAIAGHMAPQISDFLNSQKVFFPETINQPKEEPKEEPKTPEAKTEEKPIQPPVAPEPATKPVPKPVEKTPLRLVKPAATNKEVPVQSTTTQPNVAVPDKELEDLGKEVGKAPVPGEFPKIPAYVPGKTTIPAQTNATVVNPIVPPAQKKGKMVTKAVAKKAQKPAAVTPAAKVVADKKIAAQTPPASKIQVPRMENDPAAIRQQLDDKALERARQEKSTKVTPPEPVKTAITKKTDRPRGRTIGVKK